MNGWDALFPVADDRAAYSESFGDERRLLEVGQSLRLEHKPIPYTIMDAYVNDRVRGSGIAYPLMDVAKQKRAEEVGRRIAGARKKLNLSIRQLAAEVDYAHSTIEKWEKGQTSNFDYVLVRRLALLFGMTDRELMYGPGEDPWVTSRLSFAPPRKRSTQS